MAEQKRTYEVVYIVDTDATEDEITKLSENLQQIITSQGGAITKAEAMGRRTLAYPINRKNEGHYMLLEIDGSGAEIAELERRMRVNDQIIRYLTVRVDEDRRRAEKFKAKRAARAGKRAFGAGGGAAGGGGGQAKAGAAATTATAEDQE